MDNALRALWRPLKGDQFNDVQYEKGIKVTDTQFAAIRIARDDFHGEWNYVISPNQYKRYGLKCDMTQQFHLRVHRPRHGAQETRAIRRIFP